MLDVINFAVFFRKASLKKIGRDSCQGDSGGPLIGVAEKYSIRTDTRYSWIGIVR